MAKLRVRRLLCLAALVTVSMNLVAWLWVIDWCFWGVNVYLYIPAICWDEPVSKGVAVNIAYWNIVLSFIVAVVSAYALRDTQ